MQSLIVTQFTEEMPGNVIGDTPYPGRKEQAVLKSMLETSGNLPNVTMQKNLERSLQLIKVSLKPGFLMKVN